MGLFNDQAVLPTYSKICIWSFQSTGTPVATVTNPWSIKTWIQIHDCPASNLWLGPVWILCQTRPFQPNGSKWTWTEWAAVGPDGCTWHIWAPVRPKASLRTFEPDKKVTTKDNTATKDSKIQISPFMLCWTDYTCFFRAGHDWAWWIMPHFTHWTSTSSHLSTEAQLGSNRGSQSNVNRLINSAVELGAMSIYIYIYIVIG